MNWKAFLLLVLMASGTLHSGEPVRPFSPFDASAEAAARSDLRHRQALKLQLNTIEQMKWYSGFGASGFGAPYFRSPPSLDYIYAHPRWNQYGSSVPAYGVFEPWPYVPGDIWGYRWNATVRQPIGRREVQTGPNRWESHPVYADELYKSRQPALIPPKPLPPAATSEEPSSPPTSPPRRSTGPRQF